MSFGPWLDTSAPWYIRVICAIVGHAIDERSIFPTQDCLRCRAFRRQRDDCEWE
jgi:hypothetical protein